MSILPSFENKLTIIFSGNGILRGPGGNFSRFPKVCRTMPNTMTLPNKPNSKDVMMPMSFHVTYPFTLSIMTRTDCNFLRIDGKTDYT